MINIYFLFMITSVMIASVSQVLLKKSAGKKYDSFWKEYCNLYVFCGYAMLFGSMILTIMAYKGLEYKNGQVIEALGNVFVMVLSYFIFKEKISMRKIVGMVCIFAGFVVFYL